MSERPLIFDEVTQKFKSDVGVGTVDPFVTEQSTATLTNKTLTAPTITGALAVGAGSTITSPTITTPVISGALGAVTCLETLFTQIAGNKTHTATFAIPAGATILDIWVTNTVVWNSGTSATLIVGFVDDDCFFTAVDLKTVPAAGKSMNLAFPGASNGGASVPEIDGGAGNTQLGATNGLFYNAAAASLIAKVTDVNAAGTNGRTRVTVLYALPSSIVAPVVG